MTEHRILAEEPERLEEWSPPWGMLGLSILAGLSMWAGIGWLAFRALN